LSLRKSMKAPVAQTKRLESNSNPVNFRLLQAFLMFFADQRRIDLRRRD